MARAQVPLTAALPATSRQHSHSTLSSTSNIILFSLHDTIHYTSYFSIATHKHQQHSSSAASARPGRLQWRRSTISQIAYVLNSMTPTHAISNFRLNWRRGMMLLQLATLVCKVLSATIMTGDPQTFYQNELRLAREAAASAETLLSQTHTIFNKEQQEWKQSVENLQHEISVRDAVLKDASYCLKAEAKPSATIEDLQSQLANSCAELQRTKQYAAGIQKQFEAEKRRNTSLMQFPATAAGKSRTDVDQDDEEIADEATRIKQERMASNRRQNPTVQTTTSTSHRKSSRSDSLKSGTPDLPYLSLPMRVSKRSQGPAPQPSSRTKRSKRKRSSLEDEDGDYDDLDIDMDDTGGLSARKRSTAVVRGREIEHVKQTCDFKAITNYDEDGAQLYLDSKKDLSDVCPDLWERIQKQHEAWERACGEEWRYDLESKFTVSALAKQGVKPPCVTTKLLKISGGRAMWHEGLEGKYACRGCVREKRPCFTWNGEELYLLPLHKMDRTYSLEAGFEIRTWLDVE